MINFNELVARANKGNRNSQLLLGEYYLGKGNPVLAAEWLIKAAEKEDPKAQYHLSFLYHKGAGVEKDPVKAVDYLKRSAENDYVPAQTQLGSLFIQGLTVAQDEQMGLFWSRRAAAGGSEIAMYNLGIAFFRGIGMSKNIDKARDFFLRALKNGYKPAKDILINEAEAFRNENDDPDDKDFMKKIVASVESDAEIEAIANSLEEGFDSASEDLEDSMTEDTEEEGKEETSSEESSESYDEGESESSAEEEGDVPNEPVAAGGNTVETFFSKVGGFFKKIFK